MPSGFNINRSAIERMKKEIEREFNRGGGIRIPVRVDAPAWSGAGGTVHNYHGVAVVNHGDGAQIAVGDNATQIQRMTGPVTPGFEELAEAVRTSIELIVKLPLTSEDQDEVRAVGADLLAEVAKPTPDRIAVRRAVRVLQGVVAPIASGVGAGVAEAMKPEVQELARHVLALLLPHS